MSNMATKITISLVLKNKKINKVFINEIYKAQEYCYAKNNSLNSKDNEYTYWEYAAYVNFKPEDVKQVSILTKNDNIESIIFDDVLEAESEFRVLSKDLDSRCKIYHQTF